MSLTIHRATPGPPGRRGSCGTREGESDGTQPQARADLPTAQGHRNGVVALGEEPGHRPR